jgi:CheY-like chemotaxis protein
MAGESAAQPHILAINNSEDVLNLFRELLEEEGFRVSAQAYALRDLEEVKRLAPDCIILDYMWAEEDSGWSMLQMLRMDRQTKDVPIVLCTGAVREVEAMEGHLAEMGIKVVLKPFDIDHLVATVNRALGGAASA